MAEKTVTKNQNKLTDNQNTADRIIAVSLIIKIY